MSYSYLTVNEVSRDLNHPWRVERGQNGIEIQRKLVRNKKVSKLNQKISVGVRFVPTFNYLQFPGKTRENGLPFDTLLKTHSNELNESYNIAGGFQKKKILKC